MARGLMSLTIPAMLLGIVGSQYLFHWIPESAGGLNLWRVLSACLGLYLFVLAFSTEARSRRNLGRRPVSCLGCGEETDLATWDAGHGCPSCGHEAYEFAHAGTRFARYLPGAVVLDPPAPPPAPPTPISRPPRRQRRLQQPMEIARTRLGLAAQRRIRSRIDYVMVDHRAVLRV